MKQYKSVEHRYTVDGECVHLQCDMCGSVSRIPENKGWRENGWECGYGLLKDYHQVDGEVFVNDMDLCPTCVEWLMAQIKHGAIHRPKEPHA